MTPKRSSNAEAEPPPRDKYDEQTLMDAYRNIQTRASKLGADKDERQYGINIALRELSDMMAAGREIETKTGSE